jgi:hypothetical protein
VVTLPDVTREPSQAVDLYDSSLRNRETVDLANADDSGSLPGFKTDATQIQLDNLKALYFVLTSVPPDLQAMLPASLDQPGYQVFPYTV